MKKILYALAVAAMAILPEQASAGVYADDATRCMIKSTSDTDQVMVVRWVFSAIARHPAIKQYSNITNDQRAEFDKEFSTIITKLLTQTCRKETVAALKYEGPSFLEGAFGALGEVAMQGLTTNPEVAAGFSDWIKNFDQKELAALAAEAGRPLPAGK